MNSVLHFLQNRNSSPKLVEPTPSTGELREIIAAATRVPDHAWLRPWRFLAIEGTRLADFGTVLEKNLVRREPRADTAAKKKARLAPLRAPLIIVVIARIEEHVKVPAREQRLSAACAAHAILLAAEALAYAGVWRTGEAAFDRNIMTELGLSDNEEITGFIYLGTRDGSAKTLPELDPDDFLSRW